MPGTVWSRRVTTVCCDSRRCWHGTGFQRAGGADQLAGTLTRIKSGEPFRETYPTLEPATYTEYYRRFAKALAGEGEAPVTLEEASNLIRLIELAKESSRLGKTMDV